MRVGVIGTGAMGWPIAVNCLAAGHSVIVDNRTRARADELRSFGAEVPDSVGPTCSCDVVITILADDTALENVDFGSQSFSLRSRQTRSRFRKHDQREHGEEAGQGSRRAGPLFMAAPIMGRPEMAASRQISLLAAGDRSTYERCLAVLESISQNVRLVSEMPWHASLLKLCGNFLFLSAELSGEGLREFGWSGGVCHKPRGRVPAQRKKLLPI